MAVRSQKSAKYQIALFLAVTLLGRCAYAQAPALTLSSASAVQGSSVSLSLSLSAPTGAPAGLQWVLTYSPASITSLSAVAGPALTAAGAALNCNSGSGALVCL